MLKINFNTIINITIINNTKNIIFKPLEIWILDLIKAGPITELNNVPGKDPKEKQAKNIPAKLLSKM